MGRTGMKCLPAVKLSGANGNTIHDWHAEVLAIRAFNHFVLQDCQNPGSSRIVSCASGGKPYEISSRIKLHMYCSEAPCGDASMELIMAAQEDASPWETPQCEYRPDALPGRGYFSQLGVVRRKPSRADAPPTLSKSCSDKLALKQCTSLLSSITSILVHPSNAYIDTLVLPESEYSSFSCKRSFTDRMSALTGQSWPGGYAFKPFTIETTDEMFEHSRKSVLATSSSIVASNLAAIWTASGVEETTLGGVVQGHKPFSAKGASNVSRRKMWTAAQRVVKTLEDKRTDIETQLASPTYADVKQGPLLSDRRYVKTHVKQVALQGWVPNEDDSSFTI